MAANEASEVMKKPLIKAIVLDFSVVYAYSIPTASSYLNFTPRTHVDTTAVQNLVDVRAEIEKWADGPVEVCVQLNVSANRSNGGTS